jgi:hypothetical protein
MAVNIPTAISVISGTRCSSDRGDRPFAFCYLWVIPPALIPDLSDSVPKLHRLMPVVIASPNAVTRSHNDAVDRSLAYKPERLLEASTRSMFVHRMAA